MDCSHCDPGDPGQITHADGSGMWGEPCPHCWAADDELDDEGDGFVVLPCPMAQGCTLPETCSSAGICLDYLTFRARAA